MSIAKPGTYRTKAEWQQVAAATGARFTADTIAPTESAAEYGRGTWASGDSDLFDPAEWAQPTCEGCGFTPSTPHRTADLRYDGWHLPGDEHPDYGVQAGTFCDECAR